MFWVVLTLFVIGSLPFLLSWYQINQSREAVIDQAQKNHLIISRATADRIKSNLDKYDDVARNLAMNPKVYLAPDTEEASEALKAGLLLYPNIQMIGLLLSNEDQAPQVIQLARKNDSSDFDISFMTSPLNQKIEIINLSGKQYLVVKVPSARPFVDVMMLVSLDFNQWLNPSILGQSASLSLVDSAGQLIEHSGDPFVAIPKDWLTMMENGSITGVANRSEGQTVDKYISAFAKVDQQSLYVISRQSVAFAEQSTAAMSKTAWTTFSLVLLAMIALLTMAYFSWVKPIRRIVKAQNELMGGSDSTDQWEGGEVQALEKSFDALTKHINDRNALGKIFVDRYQVISPIGKGGMGTVFLGWDPKLDRHVALKTLPIGNNFGSRENMSETLVQEAITAARISHRNVVSIYDVVSTKTTAFIAMEYIKGETLSSLLEREKTLSLPFTFSITIAVLRGLQKAHKMGFVHRDIKPANILLDVNGDIKLSDFGTTALASGIGKNEITGTYGYIAPETFEHGEVTIKSDLFAIGVLIVECLTGSNPFKGKKMSQTKINTMNKKVDFPPQIRQPRYEELFQVVDLLLDKNPNKRPNSANIVAELIVQTAPFAIKWDPEVVGVRIQKNESKNETEVTVVAHS